MILLERAGNLRGLAIGVARIERGDVRLRQLGLVAELGAQPIVQRFARAVEHPQRQAQRPHVLAAQRVFIAEAEGFHRLDRLRADIEGEQIPFRQAAVLERADRVFRLLEVALGEFPGVGDDQTARLHRSEVHLERRWVHRHQHIRRVARGVDLVAAEVDLEGADAEQRALGRADFGRKIGEGGEVVAGQRGRQGELPAGKLHAVPGIAREAHHHGFGTGFAGVRGCAGIFDRLGRHSCSFWRASRSRILVGGRARRRLSLGQPSFSRYAQKAPWKTPSRELRVPIHRAAGEVRWRTANTLCARMCAAFSTC